MKTMLIIAISVLMYSAQLNAQVPSVPTVNTQKVSPVSLLSQLTSSIKPSSFTDAWASGQTNWLNSAKKITGAAGLAKSVSSLIGFIKPGMFKSGFNPQNLVSTANTVKTMADATGLLKKFEGGLKPEALVSGWASKRTGWLSALSMLK